MTSSEDRRRSDAHEYDIFREIQCEAYKESISREELLAIGDEAVRTFTDKGFNPELNELHLMMEVDRIIFERLRLPSFEAWRASQGLTTEVTAALLDAQGNPVEASMSSPLLLVSATEIDDYLLKALNDNPRAIYQLTPRKFEYLIAELLKRDGWEVEVTPASRDGGKDVIATLRTSGICSVYYVECKRYAADRPVSVKAVRELLGIIHAKRVTAGMLVTTSAYTVSARDLQKEEPHRITLKAYHDVTEWLRSQSRRSSDT